VRNRIKKVDWDTVPTLDINPFKIAPEMPMKAAILNNKGRPSRSGPSDLAKLDLNPYYQDHRLQELVFDLAATLPKAYMGIGRYEAPAHILFPQLRQICDRYLRDKVNPTMLPNALMSSCPLIGGFVID